MEPETAPPWWAGYFDEAFLRIYRPLLDRVRTAAEVDAVMEALGLHRGSTVLDVACGWGRHSLELARRGCVVTGVDLSALLLERAAEAAATEGLTVHWTRADMRELDFDGAFDAAISLFSSLGYFGSDEEDLRVLTGVRRNLRPGGLFLLETMHRDLIAREYLERDWWETPDGDTVWVEREFDAVDGVSHESLRWRTRSGEEGEKSHSIRVRCAPEWRSLLVRAELEPLEWFGGWDLEPLGHTSGRLIVVARRE